MDAKQARDTAYQINIESVNSQYGEIQASIKEAVNKGEYHCFFYENLNKDVKGQLEKEGFTVKDTSFRNETTIQISW